MDFPPRPQFPQAGIRRVPALNRLFAEPFKRF